MIIGIGHDQVDMRRLEATLSRFGQRFLDRIYTKAEQGRASAKNNPLPTYGRRWAAKEALAKALGTGIGSAAFMNEIEVINAPSGQPGYQLHGRALETLRQKIPAEMQVKLHLSLSDDWPFASAFAIIEAVSGKE